MKKIHLTIFSLLIGWYALAQNEPRMLTIQECVEIAIENNLTVRRSQLQLEQSKVNWNQSRANQLPNINLNGNYGYQWGRGVDPTSNDFITQQINFAGAGGSANVTLFNWFRIANTIKQNKLLYQSTEFDLKKAENDISLMVTTVYLNVILNQELVENAEYQLKSSEEQLDRTKKLVAGGALPRTNELELVSQVATNEVNLVNAENARDLAMLNLKQVMLLPSVENIQIVVPEIEVDMLDPMEFTAEDVFLEAVRLMPEIRSAELQVESAVRGVKAAEAGYSPSISASGSFRTNYSDAFQQYVIDESVAPTEMQVPTDYVTTNGVEILQNVQIPAGSIETVEFGDQIDQNLSRSLSLNLNIPIFNNLQARSNVQRAKIGLQQAEIAVMEQKNTLRQTIESSYNDALAASKTFQASQKQVQALEETFRSIQNQYNLGAANFTDYQVASNNLYRAKSDLVRAKYDYIFKRKIIDFYLGKFESL